MKYSLNTGKENLVHRLPQRVSATEGGITQTEVDKIPDKGVVETSRRYPVLLVELVKKMTWKEDIAGTTAIQKYRHAPA